jgi:KDO2-lipid IV(A) lauroyltransferase
VSRWRPTRRWVAPRVVRASVELVPGRPFLGAPGTQKRERAGGGAWRLLAALTALWPWWTLSVLGTGLGFLVGSVFRIRRGHVEQGMRRAGVSEPPREARAMYRALATSALELLHVAGRGARASDRVHIEALSAERWRAVVAGGRGVVVAASHTGNWDLAACAVAADIELLVVTKRLRARALDAFWQSMRARQGVRLIDADGALTEGRAVLARGGAVAMMIDQVPPRRRQGIVVEFLGCPALVDRAPAVLAAASGAPLVVAASRREPAGGQVLAVLDVLEPPARPSRAWIAYATAMATLRLEAFVRAHPSQWLWLHRRWKSLDPDPARTRLGARCP